MIDQEKPTTSASQQESGKQEFVERLKALPFMELGDLVTYASVDTDEPVLEQVDVERVVSAPNASDWTLDNPERVYRLSQAILTGEVDLNTMEPPKLFYIAGVYGVLHDGRHRVAATKLIGLEKSSPAIRAEVSPIKPFTQVFAFTQEEHNELIRRREMGLWQGNIEGGSNDFVPTGFASSGTIESYIGPWVFSKDMDKARALYTASQEPTFST